MADRRPVRHQDQTPALRDPGRLPVPVAGPAPVHQPHSLSFVDSAGTREELWERLPAQVRQKVDTRYGKLLDWWADDGEDGRVTAVVLGDQALVTVGPTLNANGGFAYRVASLQLDQSSFRSAQVTGPTGDATLRSGPVPTPRRGPGTSGQPAPPVPPELAKFLGQLPARAQALLQEPFLTTKEALDWRYHYLRHGQEQGLSSARLQLWCYLTDLRTVTFASGVGHGYRDGAGADSWQLTCWRASRR